MSLSHVARRRYCLFAVASLTILSLLWPAASQASNLYEEPSPPEVGARAAIVVEYPSGRVLFARNEHARLAPASTTKILTAILALEYGNIDDVVTVQPEDLVGEASMGLVAGEQQTIRNLLYGVMLPSGNDAATAIGRALGSKVVTSDPALADPLARFVQMMNVRVEQLGLENSHFANPHGLDAAGHYSSAYDLASLSWYAMHIPTFNEIVRQVGHDVPGHALLNLNEMLTRYPGADGIKTGLTDDAGLCLVTSATRDGRRLISVVLNAPRWYADSAALLDYGFAKLAATPKDEKAAVLSVSVRGTVSWLLVNAASAPPMPVMAPNGQGGGLVPPITEANEVAVAPANPAHAPEQAQAHVADASFALVSGSSQARSETLWALAAFALVGATSSYLLATKLWRVKPKMLLARIRQPQATPRHLQPITTPPSRSWMVQRDAVGTLGEPYVPRRREPNLLLEPHELREMHIYRAIQLAQEGRQGSSMAEFIQALRCNKYLDVAQLAESYQMAPGAFLALSRAQLAMGNREEARRTLLHGVLVSPEDRLLRLALNQLHATS
jgi:D-alanyl-D-alanine carboxypeptidase (penicillin-binding protein 5/6)